MKQFTTIPELRAYRAHLSQKAKTLALVPTMGALHDGHISLVSEGLKHADETIVSIFVNPTQFGPNEDFEAYPRNIEQDMEKLKGAGVSAVFTPSVKTMYPDPFYTQVQISDITAPLEGQFRPGHFDGVATIVAKLLMQIMPDTALFGEKDYQQLLLIQTMTRDLDIPVNIIGVPTMRDENGLALSSRNAYLSAAEYDIATQLNKILRDCAAQITRGNSIPTTLAKGRKAITEAGFQSVDYLDIRDARTMAPVKKHDPAQPARLLVAAHLGKARLIDNIAV